MVAIWKSQQSSHSCRLFVSASYICNVFHPIRFRVRISHNSHEWIASDVTKQGYVNAVVYILSNKKKQIHKTLFTFMMSFGNKNEFCCLSDEQMQCTKAKYIAPSQVKSFHSTTKPGHPRHLGLRWLFKNEWCSVCCWPTVKIVCCPLLLLLCVSVPSQILGEGAT